jgi:hypothetical protein
MRAKFEYITLQQTSPMSDYDLNHQGQVGWCLTTCVPGPSGLYYYTFVRRIPDEIDDLNALAIKWHLPAADRPEPHQHEPRASRRDPVVKSGIDPTHQEDG